MESGITNNNHSNRNSPSDDSSESNMEMPFPSELSRITRVKSYVNKDEDTPETSSQENEYIGKSTAFISGDLMSPEEGYSDPELEKRFDHINQILKRRIGLSDDLVFLEKLGGGTYGEAYRVLDLHERKFYVQKDISYKFLAEAKMVFELSQIPEPQILKFAKIEMVNASQGSILMEYGLGTLEQFGQYLILRKNGWQEHQLIYTLQKIIDQFLILQKNGIYHRDIKPANMILTIEGDLKFIDFGFGIKKATPGPAELDYRGTLYFAHPIIRTELRQKTNKKIIYDPAETDFHSVCMSIIGLLAEAGKLWSDYPTLEKIMIEEVIDPNPDMPIIKFKSLESILKSIEDLKIAFSFTDEILGFEDYVKESLISSNDPDVIKKKVELCILDGIEKLIITKLETENLDNHEIMDYHFLLANALSAKGDFRKALQSHLVCLGMRKMIGTLAQVAESNYHIGANLLALHQYEEAAEKIKTALQTYEADKTDRYLLEKANCYDCLGNISKWYLFGDRRPIDYFKDSLKLKEYAPEVPPTSIAESYFNIGTCYINAGNLKEAEKYIMQSLEKFIMALGKEHPYLYKLYLKLGEIESRKKNFDEAENFLLHSVALLSRLDPNDPHHPQLAQPYLDLGFIYLKRSIYDQAEEYFKLCLNMLKKGHNDINPYCANCYNRLSELYSEMARRHDNDPELFEAFTLESLNQLALDMREKALEIYDRLYDDDNGRIAVCLSHVARLAIPCNKEFEYIYSSFMDSLAIFSRIPDFQPRNISTTLRNLGEYLQSLNELEKSALCYYVAYLISYRKEGDKHPNTLELKDLLAKIKVNPEEFVEEQLILLPSAGEFDNMEQRKLIFEELSKNFNEEDVKALVDILNRL